MRPTGARLAAIAALALAAAAACRPSAVRRPGPPRAAASEGEAWVYLQPFPAGTDGLSFRIASIAAVAADGAEHPLHLRRADPAHSAAQQLLASGPIPGGRYAGLVLRISRARQQTAAGVSDLLVDDGPVRLGAPFALGAGRAVVLWLALAPGGSVESRFRFDPAFTASVPARPPSDAVGYVSAATRDAVFVFERRQKRVVAVLPVAASPRGLARDDPRRRVYVAAERADAVEVVDAAAGELLGRIRLELGDRPRHLALAAGGRTLLVLNAGSRTLAFVDPETAVEARRIPVPDEPGLLRLDPGRGRAYVLHGRPAGVSVVDVGSQRMVQTIATEGEPVWAELDRSGARLYILLRDLPYMDVYSLPAYTRTQRVFVGPRATVLHVDRRTDLLYVGDAGGGLTLLDPLALVPLETIQLPGAATRLAVDEAEDALLAAIPSLGRVAVIDLVSRRVETGFDVGEGAFDFAIPGAR